MKAQTLHGSRNVLLSHRRIGVPRPLSRGQWRASKSCYGQSCAGISPADQSVRITSSLGLANHFRKIIKGFTPVAAPLTAQTGEGQVVHLAY